MNAPNTLHGTPEAAPPRPPRPNPPPPRDVRASGALAWATGPEHCRWLNWHYEWRQDKGPGKPGKWDKPPYQPHAGGEHASTADPATWASYELVWKAVEIGKYQGIGLVLTGLPGELLAAVDLDDVRNPETGEILYPWAAKLIEQAIAAGWYVEITPSGRGFRILGTAPEIQQLHVAARKHPDGGQFEIFIGCTRYITVSQWFLDGEDEGELCDITDVIRELEAIGAPPRRGNGGGEDADDDGQGDAIPLGDLRHDIVELITAATENGEPVAHPGAKFKAAVGYLRKRGYGRGAALRLLAAHPDGVAGKFIAQKRLEKELARAWGKSEAPEEKQSGYIASQDATAAQERSKGKQASPSSSEDEPKGDAVEVRPAPLSGNAAATAKTKQPDAATAAKEEAQRNRLIEVALSRGIVFWRDEDGNAYATVPRKDHVERYRVRSGRFKLLLRQMYGTAYPNLIASKKFGYPVPGGVSDTAMNEALPTLEALALQGPTRQPRVRVWRDPGDGTVWIDLGDDSWALIAVRPAGWQIVQQADVPLIRSRGLRALPMPERDPAALAKLRALFNLNPEASAPAATKQLADSNFKIVVAFMLSVFWPRGPFCIMVVNGEQGTAKTSLCWIVGEMTDPNRVPLRKVPRNPEDLMITAQNRRLVPLDNVSHLASDLADTLCGIATGTGAGTREFYTNADEVLFEACNPILINGIEGLLTRGDFADRSLSILLTAIDDAERRTDEEVKEAAREVAPGVLALLLDAMVTAMRNLPALKLERMPRMADFTRLACAAAPAFGWDSDAVFAAIEDNRQLTMTAVLGADDVATAVLAFLDQQVADGEGYLWRGSVAQLFKKLTPFVLPATVKSKSWPKTGHHLSGRLRRAAPALRRERVEIVKWREGHAGRREIGFLRLGDVAADDPSGSNIWRKRASAAAAASADQHSLILPEGYATVCADAYADADSGAPAEASATGDNDLDWEADADADSGAPAEASAEASAENAAQRSDNIEDYHSADATDAADTEIPHMLDPEGGEDEDDDEERI